jgi:hypothetical protein
MVKHNVKIELRDHGYCDDPYCTGHSGEYLVCSCGADERVHLGVHPSQKTKDIARILHVLEKEGLING